MIPVSSLWYKELFDDLKKLEFSLILSKWKIGERITKDLLKFKRAEYGSKTLNNLSEDLKVSTSHLYHCISFYKKFKDYNAVIKLKAYSWRYIVHNLLTENQREEKEDKPEQEEKEQIKNFISEKLDLWKQGDPRFKEALENDCKEKIKLYKLLLNYIIELKGGLTE